MRLSAGRWVRGAILGENPAVSAIHLEQIAKHWGESRALDGITFSAEPGSFVVLLGPSGCGKSTTLRLIAGLDTPTGGTIRIGGRDVTRLPPAQRGISMVFQSYALFPHLTVAENIVFGLRVRKVRDREARLARAAELLGLGQLLARKPAQLSGGQQQRVALGRAIVAEAGRAYSSSGDPTCSMRPLRSSTTRSAIVIASVWSWVT